MKEEHIDPGNGLDKCEDPNTSITSGTVGIVPICAKSSWFTIQCGTETHFGLQGDWTINTISQLEKALEESAVGNMHPQRMIFHCSGLRDFDLSGAWILYRLAQRMEDHGVSTHYRGFKASHFKFIDSVVGCKTAPIPENSYNWNDIWIASLGRVVSRTLHDLVEMLSLFGALLVLLLRVITFRKKIGLSAIIHHIDETGLKALPIVSLIVFMISIVLAYQGAVQLGRFGSQIYTIDMVAISILREMAVLLTAIMVAGRSGSAFAAEIGVMKLNEEIDAMKTMGLSPLELLVAPRFLALVVTLPLLTVVADLSGFFGAALISVTYLDLPLSLFIERLQDASTLNHFWVGIIKAPVFAAIIAIMSIHQGFAVKQSADEIGRYTTSAVVMTIFTVIVADALFSIIFAELQL